jgi:hypothetical protein
LKPLAFSRSGKTGQAAAFGRRAESSMVNVANGSKVAVAAAGLALAGFGPRADAGLISGTSAEHQAFGQNYLVGGSAVATTGGGSVGVRAYSNVFAGGQQNTTGTMLSDRYVLIGYHQVNQILNSNPTFEISTGPNAQNNRGLVVSVSRLILFPNGSQVSTSLPEYAVLELSQAVPGVMPVTIGSATTNQSLASAGFGSWANPGGTFVRDFNIRGGMGPVMSQNDGGYSSTYYFSTLFSPGINLNWRGGNGDSGSPAFDSSGNLVGVAMAATNGSGAFGSTVFLRLDNPVVMSDLAPYIPTPGTAVALALGSAFAFRRRRE